jgi:hypothetical protein
MPTKTPITISVILTVILLLLIAAFAFFMQIILMNGVMNSSQTNIALGTSLGCQGVDIIFGAIMAGWLTRLFLTRFNMNKVLAVIVTIIPISILAAALAFVAIFVGLAAAGLI